jgi:hypothetical protein
LTPEQLTDFGRLLFGSGWVRKMAEATGHGVRTIARWKAGTMPIDPKLLGELSELENMRRRQFDQIYGRCVIGASKAAVKQRAVSP